MKSSKLAGTDLRRRAKSIESDLEASIQALEQDDVDRASENAKAVAEGLSSLISDLGADYENALLSNRLPSFAEDKAFLTKLSPSKDTVVDAKEIMQPLLRLEHYLRILKKEICLHYPKEHLIKVFLRKHKRPVITVAAITLVSIAMGTAVYRSQHKTHGLIGQYFEDRNLGRLSKQRQDPAIDFDWGRGSPFSGWLRDNYSIRWTGFIYAPAEGVYEFQTRSDDGIRLWINDKSVIDDWTTHAPRAVSGTIALNKGYHPVKLEYFEAGHTAMLKLLWRHQSEKEAKVIALKYLVPLKTYLKSGIPVYGEAL